MKGLPRNREERLVLNWPAIESYIDTIVYQLSDRCIEIDAVLPVARGGLVPAAILAYRLGVGIGGILLPGVAGVIIPPRDEEHLRRVLVVDDIIDTGETIKRIKRLLPSVRVASLLVHGGTQDLWDVCGYEVDPNVWATFPWSPKDYQED